MKKKLLLPLTILTSASLIVGCLAVKSAIKGEGLFNTINRELSHGVFDLDQSTITNVDDHYEAIAIDGSDNTVNTKFVNCTYSGGSLEFPGSKNAYFTNTNPIRGIANVTLSLSFSGDDQAFFCIAYGSYNPIVLEDIYTGKYIDLKFMGNYCSYSGETSTTIELNNYSGFNFSDCRYVLVLISNTKNYALTLTDLSFEAVCDAEPAEKAVGQSTDYKERSQMTANGVPAYFPYFGTNGYNLVTESDITSITSFATGDALGTVFDAAMNNGHELTYQEMYGDAAIMYLQKQNSDKSKTYTIGIMYQPAAEGYFYFNLAYSEYLPYMGGDSYDSWPTAALAEISSSLATAIPALELTGASYKVVLSEDNAFFREVHIPISGISNTTVADAEIAAYVANDASGFIGKAETFGYNLTSPTGQYTMQIDIGGMYSVELCEYKQLDHFPASEYNSYYSSNQSMRLPSGINVDGTYMYNSGMFKVTFDGDDDIDDLISAFTSYGYTLDGNENVGTLLPGFTNAEYRDSGLNYKKVGNNQYEMTIVSPSITPSTTLAESLNDAGNPEGFLDVITLADENVETVDFSGLLCYSYIKGEDESYINDVFNSIDVPATFKHYDSTHKIINYLVDIKNNPEHPDYVEVFIRFIVKADGLYVQFAYDFKYENGSLSSLVDATTAFAALDNSKMYAIPSGDRYVVNNTNSVSYYGTREEIAAIGEAYAQTLRINGFTENKYFGNFISPDASHYDVNISYMFNGSLGVVRFYFIDGLDANGYKNYEDAGLSLVAGIENFPAAFDKSAGKAMYYLAPSDKTISLIIDSEQFVMGEFIKSLIIDHGFTGSWSGDVIWNYYPSLTFTNSGGDVFTIHASPSRAIGSTSNNSAWLVSISYTPFEE